MPRPQVAQRPQRQRRQHDLAEHGSFRWPSSLAPPLRTPMHSKKKEIGYIGVRKGGAREEGHRKDPCSRQGTKAKIKYKYGPAMAARSSETELWPRRPRAEKLGKLVGRVGPADTWSQPRWLRSVMDITLDHSQKAPPDRCPKTPVYPRRRRVAPFCCGGCCLLLLSFFCEIFI